MSLTKDHFDVTVIGAGPSGAMIALLLARRGLEVLLVDREQFPRGKVCGACLSGRGVSVLRSHGLESLLQDSIPTHTFVLASRGRSAGLQSTGGVVISRRLLDARLVDAAQSEGVTFLDRVSAKVGEYSNDHRVVSLSGPDVSQIVSSKVIVNCAGLGRGSDSDRSLSERVEKHQLIGLTGYLQGPHNYPAGEITMAVSHDGYVGMTRQEDGLLNVSAAISINAIRSAGSPPKLVKRILKEARVSCPLGLDDASWLGTRPLTRRLRVPAASRVFVAGDAAGYVEPFTGEGMTWALEHAELLEPLVLAAVERWDNSLIKAWERATTNHARVRQRCCRMIKLGIRHPWIVSPTIQLLRQVPFASRPAMSAIHGPRVKGRDHVA